jgi:uncharacterized protein (TIGR00251 family)
MIRVQVHPGARRDGIQGWRSDGALRLSVVAAPEEGRANQAVIDLLAGVLAVPRRQVAVVRGQSSRSKQVAIEGLEEPELKRRIEEALAAGEGG